jgi:hypothetical protein
MGDFFIERRSLIAGLILSGLTPTARLSAQARTLRWSHDDQLRFAAFVPMFERDYNTPVDCADLAIDALMTFAGNQSLPIRLFDFDGPPGNRKRWLTYDPRRDDWRLKRAYFMQQLGAINVIENSRSIRINEVRAGDLIMHENTGPGDYTGHTRVLISAEYRSSQADYHVVRYEGTLPPVVPVLKEGWFASINDVYGNLPRRWNFGQFNMA